MAKNQNNNPVTPATKKTEPEAKKDALATALAQIEKQFGTVLEDSKGADRARLTRLDFAGAKVAKYLQTPRNMSGKVHVFNFF